MLHSYNHGCTLSVKVDLVSLKYEPQIRRNAGVKNYNLFVAVLCQLLILIVEIQKCMSDVRT